MTLVDSTVWIDFFRGEDLAHVHELVRLIESNEDVCICGVILTEVLQGIRDDKEYSRTLASFDELVLLPMTQQTFVKAADLYRTLRSRGLTIRNAIDCMIAAVAIEHDVPLLQHDRDFEAIASLGTLRLLNPGGPTMPSSVSRTSGTPSAGQKPRRPPRSAHG